MPRRKKTINNETAEITFSWKDEIKKLTSHISEEEKPLSFIKFLEENLPTEAQMLSKVQVEEMLAVLGEGGRTGNPEVFFNNTSRPRLAIFLHGKGAGKGTISSLAMVYLAYMLHFLKPDPYSFFGISSFDPLSIVIVSTSEDQAILFLRRIESRIKNAKFFNKFPISVGGKLYNEGVYDPKFENFPIKISSEKIYFSYINLNILSVPSRNESFEGNTVIGFVMDEASGHTSSKGKPNAERIYNTLVTSTRNLPYLGFITSYPRGTKRVDFTYIKFKEGLHGLIPNVYCSHKTSWEANPTNYFRGISLTDVFRVDVQDKEFENLGLRTTYYVPTTLKAEFERDFNTAVSRYIALPLGEAKDRWISVLDQVDLDVFIDTNRPPVIRYEHQEKVTRNGISVVTIEFDREKDIDKSVLSLKNYYQYFIGLDAGQTDSNAAIVLAHGIIQHNTPILVVDAILLWRPDKKRGLMVDLVNFMKVVTDISQIFNVRLIRSDKWQVSGWAAAFPNWNTKPPGRPEYNMLKALLSNNPPLIRLPAQRESRELLLQLKELETPSTDLAKPRVSQGHQDLADALAGAVGCFMEIFSLNPETLQFEIKQIEPTNLDPEQNKVMVELLEKAPPTAPLSSLSPLITPASTPTAIVVGGKKVYRGPIVPGWVKFGSF
ncbi:MAG: hypothetical protein QXF61_09230 [Nitrososphaeria archaeon]